MIKIILVGDIGSGKTYVSRLFKVPCFSADLEVKKLYKNNRKCFQKLKKSAIVNANTPVEKFNLLAWEKVPHATEH